MFGFSFGFGPWSSSGAASWLRLGNCAVLGTGLTALRKNHVPCPLSHLQSPRLSYFCVLVLAVGAGVGSHLIWCSGTSYFRFCTQESLKAVLGREKTLATCKACTLIPGLSLWLPWSNFESNKHCERRHTVTYKNIMFMVHAL